MTALESLKAIKYYRMAQIEHTNWATRFKMHFVCSRKSNISFCCCLFYLFIWRPLFIYYSIPFVRRFIDWWPPRYAGYIPCPICYFKKNLPKIKRCQPDDKDCCRAIF